MEVVRLGNIYGFDGGNYAGNVYSKNFLAPTLLNMTGGNRQPMIIDEIQVLNPMEDGTCRTLKNQYAKNSIANFESQGTWGATGVIAIDEQNMNVCTETFGTLTTDGSSPKHNNRVMEGGYKIRKLTPKECWRLMGFTDEDFMKAEMVNSNTQLYKQAGNSIVKDVLMAIFKEMM